MTESEQRRWNALLDSARAFAADVNDDVKRLDFLKRTFNLDRLAALLIAANPDATSLGDGLALPTKSSTGMNPKLDLP